MKSLRKTQTTIKRIETTKQQKSGKQSPRLEVQVIRLAVDVLVQLVCAAIWLAAVLTAILSAMWVFS